MTTAASHTPRSPSSTYTRLHITPLDESLLEVIVPASVRPYARRISYHTIETFPEKKFGFVELPTMEAEKLKKKLNGATLKGTKVRIEQAKPDNIPEPAGVEADDVDSGTMNTKKPKKRKREEGVLKGVELTDRKVKRGWTSTEEPKLRRDRKEKDKKDKRDKKEKKKKREIKSKYTEEPEMLFKTQLTPTAAASSKPDERKKKRKKSSREVVVHEFENTTKVATFLKSSSMPVAKGGQVTEFVQGQGWVDADGNVVEEAKPKVKPGLAVAATPKPKKVSEEVQPEADDDTSSEDETSSDESADSEESNVDSARPKSSASAKSLTIKIPPATPIGAKVHPLEALYKKGGNMTPADSKDESSFNFFGDAPEEGGEEEECNRASSLPVGSQVPMTPYTRQDIEFRNLRSAAPTPDTAHINKTFRYWPKQDDMEEEEEEEAEGKEGEDDDEMMDISQTENHREEGEGDAEEGSNRVSDFQKTFYAQRSDINKAWREARKASRKEKRYRENKSRGSRAY